MVHPDGRRGKEKEDSGMELHVWGGGWGLPSVDPESLRALAAIRFAGAPARVIECCNPWKSPKGLIPFFKQINSDYLYSAHEVGMYLKTKNFTGDYGLTSVQCSETVAYGQLIWDALHIAYLYFFWVHENNYSEIVRPFYGRRLPWVYKLWYPDRLRTDAKVVVQTIFREVEEHPESAEPHILEKAKQCIKLLSEKLDENEFFMKTPSPTTMDAFVFSYLAPFWKVKLQHNPLKEFITKSPNLDKYLHRISQRYFPPPGRNPGTSSAAGTILYGDDGEPTTATKKPDDGALNNYQKVGAGILASALMLLYAVKNGIVRMPGNAPADVSSHPEEDEDYWE